MGEPAPGRWVLILEGRLSLWAPLQGTAGKALLEARRKREKDQRAAAKRAPPPEAALTAASPPPAAAAAPGSDAADDPTADPASHALRLSDPAHAPPLALVCVAELGPGDVFQECADEVKLDSGPADAARGPALDPPAAGWPGARALFTVQTHSPGLVP